MAVLLCHLLEAPSNKNGHSLTLGLHSEQSFMVSIAQQEMSSAWVVVPEVDNEQESSGPLPPKCMCGCRSRTGGTAAQLIIET